jgi:hypothetical protein
MAATTGEGTPGPTAEPATAPAPGAPQTGGSAPGGGSRQTRKPLIYTGELTTAVCALALLILMFATKWYGVAGVPDPSAARPAISTAINGWHGLTIVRWVMLITIVAALGSVVLRVSQRSHGSKTDTSRVLTALGSLTAILLIYRVLIALPSAGRVTDQKLGAVLGMLCALGIAVGGRQSMLERKAVGRSVARRARAASASPER